MFKHIKSNRFIAILTGIQVIRALWKIWDAMDRKWTDSIVVLISPAVYISCLLTILIATTSVVVTWSVYHVHMPTLNVGWWLFYLLTICSFLNDCVYLGISSTTKEQFISDCISDAIVAYHQGCGSSANTTSSCQNIVPVPSISDCKQSWAFVVIQFSIVTILDLVINVSDRVIHVDTQSY